MNFFINTNYSLDHRFGFDFVAGSRAQFVPFPRAEKQPRNRVTVDEKIVVGVTPLSRRPFIFVYLSGEQRTKMASVKNVTRFENLLNWSRFPPSMSLRPLSFWRNIL
jgi:hypothetical protein